MSLPSYSKRTVEFANENDMQEAIRLFDDYDYNGSRLTVKKDSDGGAPPRDRSPPRRRDDSPPRRRDDSPPRDRSPPRRRDDSPPRRRFSASPDRNGHREDRD